VQVAIGLVGVIIGALLAGAAQYMFLRRRERVESRVATRLVILEIANLAHLIHLAGRYAFDSTTYSTAAFERHHDVLARDLPDSAWDEVAEAYALLSSMREAVGLSPEVQLPGRKERLERIDLQTESLGVVLDDAGAALDSHGRARSRLPWR
jgi:hypothetical protein